MKLTRQAEIAIQILALCARPADNAPVTTRIAADFADTTKDHAAHVVAKLVRHGYLEGTRGRAGGIKLARPAAEIGVGDILRLVEPAFGAFDPIEQHTDAIAPFEILRRAAANSYVSTFDDFTVADLVSEPAASRLRCLDCDLRSWIARPRRQQTAFGAPGHATGDKRKAAAFHPS